MYKVILFAGTTEGYDLAGFLSRGGVSVCACVATEYGSRSLEEGPFLHIEAGRLNRDQMTDLFREHKPLLVIDATHPYAAEVTANISAACQDADTEYMRVLRSAGDHAGQGVYVDSTEAAIEYLKGTEGNILLTTGSKELKKYTALPDYKNRLYARVLSLPGVMAASAELGFEGRHLIGMQGPFITEINTALLIQYDCKYLVTKDTGKEGGFQEKIDAAIKQGVTPVIIGRPLKEEGLSLTEARKTLQKRFSIKAPEACRAGEYSEKMPEACRAGESPEKAPEACRAAEALEKAAEDEALARITLLGIGMGSRDSLTLQGQKALEEADLLIGAKRIADSVALPHHRVIYEYLSREILKILKEDTAYKKAVIVLSGDVGFYSGAKKLLDGLSYTYDNKHIRVICGISSVAYFMARLGLSWDDADIVSAHGRECNLLSHIRYHKKVFSILGTSDGVAALSRDLCQYGLADARLYVGERLSYDDEKIFHARACELTDYEGDPLSVVCIINDEAEAYPSTHGIKDDMFERAKVPMTKEEVRCVSLSKLGLFEDSICYDVGAGTGSVSIEMALRAPYGMVYAIEKKPEAVELLNINKKKFKANNLEIIEGTAPEALEGLPVPTHAFIGGSSGQMREITGLLLKKNPDVRIVVNCIALETLTEVLSIMKDYDFEDTDLVQLSVDRSRKIGPYSMMMGENPIYIITMQNPKSL